VLGHHAELLPYPRDPGHLSVEQVQRLVERAQAIAEAHAAAIASMAELIETLGESATRHEARRLASLSARSSALAGAFTVIGQYLELAFARAEAVDVDTNGPEGSGPLRERGTRDAIDAR